MLLIHSKIFLIKAKINKLKLIRLISFYTVKEIINKIERQTTEWGKYLKVM